METKNIHQRIAAVMAEVTYIQKEKKQGMNYTVVSHDAVTAKVRPALLKYGVIYYPTRCVNTHNGNRAECSVTVRFANVDSPSDCIDVETFGYGVDPQDKGPGKAMSYAVKYAVLKVLALETGDDADLDSVDHDTKDPAVPAFNARAAADLIKAKIARARTMDELREAWTSEAATLDDIKAASQPIYLEVEADKNTRKIVLQAA